MPLSGLSRCTYALWLAVVLDVVGLATLLVGVFGNLQRGGRDYGDMLIYTGAIVVFVSLIGWVFWYTGNIEISLEELASDYCVKDSKLHRIVRKISRSISLRNGNGRADRATLRREAGQRQSRWESGHPEEEEAGEGPQECATMG
ncbi:transmembrane protein 238-like [Scyliorhinus canicula]|uniref:transmembrane protein 238-like n=1 Tax=Scyliorhinus canicula TaxID=7830 RepID=UPI0018F5AD8B|nr:transmembrane protein 238-like [Scyliorhinus canicula]